MKSLKSKRAEAKDLSTKVFLVWFTTGLDAVRLGRMFDIPSSRVRGIIAYGRRKMYDSVVEMKNLQRPHPEWWKRLRAANAIGDLDHLTVKKHITGRYKKDKSEIVETAVTYSASTCAVRRK